MTPATAQGWRKALRALMQHCVKLELVREDPTLGIRLQPIRARRALLPIGCAISNWDPTGITAHPVGFNIIYTFWRNRLGLFGAQRRGDYITMGPQHIRNGMLRVKQQKTKATLSIPVHPELQAVINAAPAGHLTFLQAL